MILISKFYGIPILFPIIKIQSKVILTLFLIAKRLPEQRGYENEQKRNDI